VQNCVSVRLPPNALNGRMAVSTQGPVGLRASRKRFASANSSGGLIGAFMILSAPIMAIGVVYPGRSGAPGRRIAPAVAARRRIGVASDSPSGRGGHGTGREMRRQIVGLQGGHGCMSSISGRFERRQRLAPLRPYSALRATKS
jgi:hypothetical protein